MLYNINQEEDIESFEISTLYQAFHKEIWQKNKSSISDNTTGKKLKSFSEKVLLPVYCLFIIYDVFKLDNMDLYRIPY